MLQAVLIDKVSLGVVGMAVLPALLAVNVDTVITNVVFGSGSTSIVFRRKSELYRKSKDDTQ
jgi:hypothetical protein